MKFSFKTFIYNPSYTAEALGRIIISEVNNPPSSKTIRPLSESETLGGENS